MRGSLRVSEKDWYEKEFSESIGERYLFSFSYREESSDHKLFACLIVCPQGQKNIETRFTGNNMSWGFSMRGTRIRVSSWPCDPFLRVLLGATVNSQSESSFEKSAYLGVSRCGELESEASLRKSCLDIGSYVFIINSLLTNHIFDETQTKATKHGESEFEVDFIHYMLISFN